MLIACLYSKANIYCTNINDNKCSVLDMFLFLFAITVYRVPGFLSSRPNWVPPLPHPQEIGAPLVVKGGRHTPLRGRGWGHPIPTMGQTPFTLGILYKPSTCAIHYTLYYFIPQIFYTHLAVWYMLQFFSQVFLDRCSPALQWMDHYM
jgi:hypothetical protein